MTTIKVPQKKIIPAPGRKLSKTQARAMVNQRYGKVLAMLAK